jgi:hypothetical protein
MNEQKQENFEEDYETSENTIFKKELLKNILQAEKEVMEGKYQTIEEVEKESELW